MANIPTIYIVTSDLGETLHFSNKEKAVDYAIELFKKELFTFYSSIEDYDEDYENTEETFEKIVNEIKKGYFIDDWATIYPIEIID